jgi:lysophospholipase L1-like esterase
MLSWQFSLYSRSRVARLSLLVLVSAFLVGGCGDGVVNPSTLAPVIVCPMPVAAQSVDGNPVTVTYEPPQVVAGEPPLRISCTPQSGTLFPLGVSAVTCSVADSVGRVNACSFNVTVTRTPRLSASTFMAFGNSITEGKTAFGATPNNYPENLRKLLTARYTTQEIKVFNRGLGGETAVNGAIRIHQDLDDFNPQVLLLEEGVNDLALTDPAKIDNMIAALRDMIREAKSRSIVVFLATLTPVRRGGTPPRGDAAYPFVLEANSRIRALALTEGTTLVDLFEGFGGSPDPYIDVDGLHPNEAGYQRMADLFFFAIRQRLESVSGTGSETLVTNLPALGAGEGLRW